MRNGNIEFDDRNIIRDSLLKLYSLFEESNSAEYRRTIQNTQARHRGELPIYAENKAFPQYVMIGTTWYPEKYFYSPTGNDLTEHFPYSKNQIQLPVYINLLNGANLFVEYDENSLSECQKFTHNIMWSFLSEIPVSKLCISIFDCERRGGSITPFLGFRKSAPDVFDDKIYTDRESVNNRLKRFNDEIDERIQASLGTRYRSIIEYNRHDPSQGEPVHLLVINDFPSGFSSDSMNILLNILKNGSKCGIYTVISYNRDVKLPEYERAEAYIDSLKEQSNVFRITDGKCCYKDFASPVESDIHISEQTSAVFTESYLNRRKSLNGSSLSMRRVIDRNLFERSSRYSLEIPVGVGDAGETVQLTLGKGSSHHALIAGATGSGKSSLLHTLILSAMLHYKPEELNLYLMDFKSGTEFKVYENYRLPHIKLLALDAMQEFGESILEKLVNEMTERSSKFKSAGAANLGEYVSATGDVMPRILVVMDEFQILYNESQNRKTARNCAELTKRIVTEGRSFGIHLIMATQSTSIISELSLSSGVIDQMRIRIGLKCGENDARYLFKDNSTSALELMKGPVGKAVMNPEYMESDNIGFRTAYCDDAFKNNCLKVIEDEFLSSEYTMQTFEGSRVTRLLEQYARQTDIEPNPVNVSVEVAEMIKVAPPLRLVFDKKRKHNVLICGSGERTANNLFNVLMLGILKNSASRVYCMDGDIFVDEEAFMPFYRQYERFDGQFRLAQTNNDIADFVNEIYESFKQRKKAKSSTAIFVALRNFRYIELCKKLLAGEYFDESEYIDVSVPADENNSDDIFDFGVSSSLPTSDGILAKFTKLINEGSAYGIHFLISCTDFQAVKETMYYGSSVLNKFPDRFVFELNDNDAGMLIDEISTASLGDNTVFYSDGVKTPCQVKPYLFPSADELKAYMDSGMNDAQTSQNTENARRGISDNTNGLSAIERLNALCGDDDSAVSQACEETLSEDTDTYPLYLANILYEGFGVKRDLVSAFRLYSKAAKNGYIDAMLRLGKMYYNGEGVEKSYIKAFYWYEIVAEEGYAEGMNALARMYKKGQGITASYTKAFEWHKKAAEAGHPDSMNSLAEMYYSGTGTERDYTSAVKWYKKAAEAGNSGAMDCLGDMYYYGHGVKRDYSLAAEWFKKGADTGNSAAMFNLAFIYENGRGVKQDYSAAYVWYKKAAEAGKANAMNSLGDMYYYGHGVKRDHSAAFVWFRKAAEAGHANGMDNLGFMYRNGYGTGQDLNAALEWYKKAAAAGNAAGMNNLGDMYYFGRGVKKDYTTAFEWFKKAAEAGSADGMDNLGFMYRNGRGVEKNLNAALEWYKKAAAAGKTYSMNILGDMYYNGNIVKKDYGAAFEWYKKAAAAGNVDSMNSLGEMYNCGRGVERDHSAAYKWFSKAAEAGNVSAMNSLAALYRSGLGVGRDLNAAFKWFKKAAEEGNVSAMNSVGMMYYNGQGIKRNYNEAYEWFTNAAEEGNTNAMTNLGDMYYNGKGVDRSFSTALEWYEKAADAGNADAMKKAGDVHYRRGDDLDHLVALAWYKKAADAGNASAMNSLGDMFYEGIGVSRNYSSAFVWYKNAAEAGNASAMNSLGYMLQEGIGVSRDYSSAFVWYKKAAEAGNDSAMYNLGYMYHKGMGVSRDYSAAVEWYRKAFAAGNTSAMNSLGYMYQEGLGVERDYSEALEWYTMAANAGDTTAMENIAYMYQHGLGVQRSYSEAKKWLKKAKDSQ